MGGAGGTGAVGLSTGFQRSARAADLPDVLMRFRPEDRDRVDAILRRLPNLEGRAYRLELHPVALAAGFHAPPNGAVQAVDGARRGDAVVDGRDLRGLGRREV